MISLLNWRLHAAWLLALSLVVGIGGLALSSARSTAAASDNRAKLAEFARDGAIEVAYQVQQEAEAASARARAANAKRATAEQSLGAAQSELERLAGRVAQLDGDFRVLHDAAAAGCAPPGQGAQRGRDATPVDARTLARTVTRNYCRAEANRQQLLRLQAEVQAEAAR